MSREAKANHRYFVLSPDRQSQGSSYFEFGDYEKILNSLGQSFEERWATVNAPSVGIRAKLEDFEMIRTLGRGASGRVMLVKRKALNGNWSYYAMKILDKVKLVKMKQVEHTHTEKRVLYSIMSFPFAMRLEYSFKDNSYLYMVLAFVNGGDMFKHLRKLGKFDEGLARFYAAQVTLALEYFHRCGFVHRDLKPENILIDQAGYVRFTDFGFAKMMNSQRTWTFCGTPEYIAPEIVLSKGYGKSVDWWSFGVLLYEMMAGYTPFFSKNHRIMYEKITTATYRFPSFFSKDARDLVKNLLQVDLTQRYGNLRKGSLDIKSHSWFSTVNWMNIYHKRVVPTFVPSCGGPGDARNFDKCDEEDLVIATTNKYHKEFADF